jgi:hypothetical protein
MSCEKHPNRDSVANCQFCGKELCEDCKITIAGKNYCEECMSELVGPELTSIASNKDSAKTEPQKSNFNNENNQIPNEPEISPVQERAQRGEQNSINDSTPEKPSTSYDGHDDLYSDDRLYNDTHENKPITPNNEVEDKYEKYLDDLYFDEKPQTGAKINTETNLNSNSNLNNENSVNIQNKQFEPQSQRNLSLSEQLAMDEAEHGSITKEPFIQEEPEKKQDNLEENEAKNRNVPIMENLRKTNSNTPQKDTNTEYTPSSLHRRNIHYKQEEKKPFSSTETILTVILILLIISVVIYVVYLLTLHSQYPNILDAINSLF